MKKRVLVCGHRSFAAQGLVEKLTQAGHHVVCFTRGNVAVNDYVVTGPVYQLATNPHLGGSFDVVINYILIKEGTVQDNIDYIDSLLHFCGEHQVKHLIHLSSISVYDAKVHLVTEDAKIETEPHRKGSYGALKVASEQRILHQLPPEIKLSLIRPGFVLGKGLLHPMPGIGIKLPWNRVLAIGNGQSHLPVITRELLNETILRTVDNPPTTDKEVLLVTHNDSPTRKEYLTACCTKLGCGTRASSYPTALWLLAGIGGEMVARLTGQSHLQPFMKLRAACRNQDFDSTQTQQRLGIDFSFDWQTALQESLEGQEVNFSLPYTPKPIETQITAEKITFIGFGRIVKQKHLPALKRLGFKGKIEAYDLTESYDNTGIPIHAIDVKKITEADLFVVASPGPAHLEAIRHLKQFDRPILVEKPLCYSIEELKEWLTFATTRQSPIMICHNYRFKTNVMAMLSVLQQFNPGQLHHVDVSFQSPPVSSDGAVWLRNERKARTLLLDYSLHFLDIACMFAKGEWQVPSVRYVLNSQGQTGLIEGYLAAENYTVNFLLRQGFGPRRARLWFNFQNYSVSLGFFPDTFAVYMANDNPFLYRQEMLASLKETSRKIFDKLTHRDSDVSHVMALASATQTDNNFSSAIQIENLTRFYNLIFQLEQKIYEERS
jgi:nucleoside-diphosphate-sugar epimerase